MGRPKPRTNEKDIEYVQTVLPEFVIARLKEKTNKFHTKDALTKALEHARGCKYADFSAYDLKSMEIPKGTKFLHVQTMLTVKDIKFFKKLVGEDNTKDMIFVCVHHFLKCEHTGVGEIFDKKFKKSGSGE